MARGNPTWGEERIAADLLLKLGIRVSLRTGRRDMPNGARGRDGPSSQRWRIVVRPHTEAMEQGQAWLLGSLGQEEDFCSIDGPGERSPNGTVDYLPRRLPHEALESSSQIKWIASTRRVQTEILRITAMSMEAALSFWRVFSRASVVMANEIFPSGSRQGEDSLGALKEPPRLRK